MPKKCWIFGYGSLINNESRQGKGITEALDGAVWCRVSGDFGFVRSFSSHSETGFTAIGLVSDENAPDMCGVLFPVDSGRLIELDDREKDYMRVELPHSLITGVRTWEQSKKMLKRPKKEGGNIEESSALAVTSSVLSEEDAVHIYIPHSSTRGGDLATNDFPIVQTYVDTCLGGCIAWGGVEAAEDFVISTRSWSQSYLNDCPLSRRPWVFRPHYELIDSILQKHAEHTHFSHRRHSDSSHIAGLPAASDGTQQAQPQPQPSGMWGCPPRNRDFVGRDTDLEFVSTTLEAHSYAVLLGLGGMGKSSLAVEYCHRNCLHGSGAKMGANGYSLVVFLRAESISSISADISNFLEDYGWLDDGEESEGAPGGSPRSRRHDSKAEDRADGTVVNERFRRCLSTIETPILVIFDNLELGQSASLRQAVHPYLPGDNKIIRRRAVNDTASVSTAKKVHVIVTMRSAVRVNDLSNNPTELTLTALQPQHSLQFFQKALNLSSIEHRDSVGDRFTETEEDEVDLLHLAERLGHMPLALTQAASFMSKVDICAGDYLQRLEHADADGGVAGDALNSVHTSLCVALDRMSGECPQVLQALLRMSWLSPECVTKHLLHKILATIDSESDSTLPTFRGGMPHHQHPPPSIGIPAASMYWVLSKGSHAAKFAAGLAVVAACAASFTGFVMLAGATKSTVSNLTGGQRYWATMAGAVGVGALAMATGSALTSEIRTQSHDKTGVSQVPTQTDSPDVKVPREKSSQVNLVQLTDRVWDTLKQYGLLTVRGPRKARVGSIHRLQLQYIRTRPLALNSVDCVSDISVTCLEQCIRTLSLLWNGDTTGSATLARAHGSREDGLLNHIQSLAAHVEEYLPVNNDAPGIFVTETSNPVIQMTPNSRTEFASLLTNGASYVILMESRFETAYTLLKLAITLLELPTLDSPVVQSGHSEIDCRKDNINSEDSALLARTLHVYGTACRLGGKYGIARGKLNLALKLRRQLTVCPTWGVADTLHELGIVHLRCGEMDLAGEKFHESLILKRSLGDADNMSLDSSNTSTSATLHQLAMLATVQRKYEDAETLLSQALQLEGVENGDRSDSLQEGKGGARRRSLVSRAAMTQQLGKVKYRRGDLKEARAALQHSLDIYAAVYGASSLHINVASTHQALASVLLAMGTPEGASEHLQQALLIRTSVLPESHPDVLMSYSDLAKLEQQSGSTSLAANLWTQQSDRIYSLMSQKQYTEGGSYDMTVYAKLLLTSLYHRRQIAKQAQDTALVTELSASINRAKAKALSQANSCADARDPAREVSVTIHTTALCKALKKCRSCIRASARAIRRGETTSSSLKSFIAPISEALNRLQEDITESSEISESSDKIILSMCLHFHKEATSAVECALISSTGADEVTCRLVAEALSQSLFIQCDGVRSKCRGIGIIIED